MRWDIGLVDIYVICDMGESWIDGWMYSGPLWNIYRGPRWDGRGVSFVYADVDGQCDMSRIGVFVEKVWRMEED